MGRIIYKKLKIKSGINIQKYFSDISTSLDCSELLKQILVWMIQLNSG